MTDGCERRGRTYRLRTRGGNCQSPTRSATRSRRPWCPGAGRRCSRPAQRSSACLPREITVSGALNGQGEGDAGRRTEVWRGWIRNVENEPLGMLEISLAEANSDGQDLMGSCAITLPPLMRHAVTFLMYDMVGIGSWSWSSRAEGDERGRSHDGEETHCYLACCYHNRDVDGQTPSESALGAERT
jgi:hypothetical protein